MSSASIAISHYLTFIFTRYSSVVSQNVAFMSHYDLTNRLKGQTAIVTGASAGIGSATVQAMIKNGIDSIVCADINEKALNDFVKKAQGWAKEAGGKTKISHFKADVSKNDDVARLVDHCVTEHGKLTIMFNNAGMFVHLVHSLIPPLPIVPFLHQLTNNSLFFFELQGSCTWTTVVLSPPLTRFGTRPSTSTSRAYGTDADTQSQPW